MTQATPSGRPAYLALVLLLLGVTVGFDSLHPVVRWAGLGLVAFILGAWLLFRLRPSRRILLPSVLLPLLAFETYRLISVAWAPLPGPSLERLLKELLLLLAGLFIADLFTARRRLWDNALLNFAAVFVLVELALALVWYQRWTSIAGSFWSPPPFGYRLTGTLLGHPNVLSGFLNLVLPILLARLLTASDRKEKAAYALGMAPLLATQYFASSRAGWLAGAAAMAATAAVLLGPRIWRRLRDMTGPQRKSLGGLLPYTLGGLALVALAVALGYLISIQARVAPGHASGRGNIWTPAWNAFLVSPVVGRGPGAFPALFDRSHGQPEGFATSHAHNALLQIALEGGLVGLVLLAWVCWAIARAFLRRWRKGGSSDRVFLAGYIGAAVGLATHHMVDYLFETPLFSLAVLGMVMVTAPLEDGPFARTSRRVPAALLAVLMSLLALFAVVSRGSLRYWTGLLRASANDWQGAAEDICSSANANPAWTLYTFQCVLAETQASQDSDEKARRLLSQALEFDPYWPVHRANLAGLEWAAGDRSRALDDLREAMQSEPRNPVILLNLGWMEEQSGDLEGARREYATALNLDPWLMRRVFFSRSPVRREVAEAAISASLALGSKRPEVNGWLALDQGEWPEAEAFFREALAGNPRSGLSYAGMALALDAIGQSKAASRSMAIALFLEAGSPQVLHAASRLATRAGDSAGARDLLERAYRQARDASTSWLYYARAYFRFFLPGDVVPQLRTATLTQEMAEDVERLAEVYDQEGRVGEAERLRRFIAGETSP